jgi:hypothetical protein
MMKIFKQLFNIAKKNTLRDSELEDQPQPSRAEIKQQERFMRTLYQAVSTHRNNEAINLLLDRYDINQTPGEEFETLFEYITKWGASRTLLCLGRLIIHKLDKEKRYGRALFYVEKCQAISPQFILADLSRTLFYAEMAIETGKREVAKKLLINPESRYGNLVYAETCHQLLQRAE